MRRPINISKEQLLQNIMDEFNKTHQAPTLVSMPHYHLYIKYFGSWNDALSLVGLTSGRENRRKCSKEELLQAIRDRYEETGRVPCFNTMKYQNQYYEYFGSWNNAVKMANLQPNYNAHTKEELMEILYEFSCELGYFPTKKHFERIKPHGVSSQLMVRSFNMYWGDICKLTGLNFKFRKRYIR